MAKIKWTRGEQIELSEFFLPQEFECHCGVCKVQEVDSILIEKLTAVRKAVGHPIKITSGLRCESYQDALAVAGYPTAIGVSPHELGIGADISLTNGINKDILIKELDKKFKAMGIATDFIHVDLRNDKKRRWFYK